MNDDNPYWDKEEVHKHGYYEQHVLVWNPQEDKDENTIRNLVIDILGDEEKIQEATSRQVVELLNEQTERIDEQLKRVFTNELHKLLRRDLIIDAHCPDHNIHGVDDLKNRLDDDDFSTFPL